MKEFIKANLEEAQSEIIRIESYLEKLYHKKRTPARDTILSVKDDLARLKLREEILKQKLEQIEKEERINVLKRE